MGGKRELKFDEIGYWSELKLEIIKKYAAAYSKILAAQRDPEQAVNVASEARLSSRRLCWLVGSPSADHAHEPKMAAAVGEKLVEFRHFAWPVPGA